MLCPLFLLSSHPLAQQGPPPRSRPHWQSWHIQRPEQMKHYLLLHILLLSAHSWHCDDMSPSSRLLSFRTGCCPTQLTALTGMAPHCTAQPTTGCYWLQWRAETAPGWNVPMKNTKYVRVHLHWTTILDFLLSSVVEIWKRSQRKMSNVFRNCYIVLGDNKTFRYHDYWGWYYLNYQLPCHTNIT